MNHLEKSSAVAKTGISGRKKLGMAIAVAAVTMVAACNYGGDHETPHAPVNPAMQGSPQESDHTNADADDLDGGYGTGTAAGEVKDDNIQRTQGSPIPIPMAKKDSTAK